MRALIPVLGAVLLIHAGPDAWINRHLLSNRLMVGIGLISYPLYLWHWPILSYLLIMRDSEALTFEWRIGAITASFLLAWATWRFIERPARKSAMLHGRTSVFLLSLALALAGMSFATWKLFDGFPSRIERMSEYWAIFDPSRQPWTKENQQPFCKERIAIPDNPNFYCRQSADREPEIILLGDSHTVALFPSLAENLEKSGLTLLQTGAPLCLPFRKTISADKSSTIDQRSFCPLLIGAALDYALASPQVKTVILLSRGPLHLTGKNFVNQNNFKVEPSPHRFIYFEPEPHLQDPEAVWMAASRATLTELFAAGKQVIFVLDNPELNFDPKSCVALRPFRLQPLRSPCAVPRAEYDARNARYRALIESIHAEFPQLIVIDGARPFCDEQWCYASNDGKMFYFDGDHLSYFGAQLLAQEIVPKILRNFDKRREE
jgi:hypothetical protein